MSVLEEKLQRVFVYAASFYTHVSAPSDRRLAPLPNAARDQRNPDSRRRPRSGGRTARLSDSDGSNQRTLEFLLFLFKPFCATILKTA
jgi:hypothetical protein